jgi:SAM-dependent methyltransferase
MPINVCVQWPSRAAARQCPRGPIVLRFCPDCGFMWNSAFASGRLDYSQAYENSLFFSPRYQAYTQEVIQRLIQRYDVRRRDVIDIGCGKGDFLFLLCRAGDNRGTGFDTSYEGLTLDEETARRVTIIRDFYSEKYASCPADLICSRYVFEHIEAPREFLGTVRRAIGNRANTIVYFEVPNVSLILRDLSVWDIIYEHCSYFGRSSLRRVFTECGFEVLDLSEGYAGQFLGIEARVARPGAAAAPPVDGERRELTSAVGTFAAAMRQQMECGRGTLARMAAAGRKTVIWGAGAKGVSFVNMLGITDAIRYMVDINPRKQGKFVAGGGQEVVGPEFLRQYRPDCVILPNPIYRDEVRQTLHELGLAPELIWPPLFSG